MKLLITFISLAVVCVANPTTVRSVKGRFIQNFGPVASRRQGVSYVTNVIHQDPKHPEHKAQSTVNVQFLPSFPNTRYHQFYQNNLSPQQVSQYFQTEPSQQVSQQLRPANANFIQKPQTAEDSESNQSQSFNVGYSVRFTNPVTPKIPSVQRTKKAQRSQNLDQGEIITGTRKINQQIKIPDLSTASQELNSLVSNAQHKLSGIKPKNTVQTTTTPVPDHKTILAQANLSPNTQKYFHELEKAQAAQKQKQQSTQIMSDLSPQINPEELSRNMPNIEPSPIPERKFAQSKSAWQTLGSGVEIYQSKELHTNVDITPQETAKPRYFDHAYALGKSQGFDYSNVVDVNGNFIQGDQKQYKVNQNQQNQVSQNFKIPPTLQPATSPLQQLPATLQSTAILQPSPTTFQHLPVTLPAPATLQPAATTLPQVTFQQALPSPVVPNSFYNHFALFQPPAPSADIPQIVPTTSIRSPQIGLMLPPITNGNVNHPVSPSLFQSLQDTSKYPVDTRLVREPVLTTEPKKVIENPNVIPIHFDTRLLQAMQQKINYQHVPESLHPSQTQQINQFTAPDVLPDQNFQAVYFQKFNIPQLGQFQQGAESIKNEEFEPYSQIQQTIVNTPKPQTSVIQQQKSENQKDNSNKNINSNLDGYTKFKIYGKPQAVGGVDPAFKNNVLNEGQKIVYGQRQPRYRTDYKLGTELRPPPLPSQGSYQRRVYLGK